MAWFQNLAGRAEDLLNRLDQNAAVVLNEPTLPKDNYHETAITKNMQTSASVPNLTYFERGSNSLVTFPEGSEISLPDSNKSTNNIFPEITSDSILEELSSNTSYISDDYNKIDDFSQTLDNVKHSLQSNDFDTEIKQEQTSRTSSCNASVVAQESLVQHAYEERINNLETENIELNKQLLNLQHVYAELQHSNISLQSQFERANECAELAQKDMEQYRARAQRVLQEKERLIASKQELNDDKYKNDNLDATISSYNDELKKELNFQQEKYKELTLKFERVKDELITLQQQQVTSQQETVIARQSLQHSLLQERRARAAAEDDARVRAKELQMALQQIAEQQNEISQKSQQLSQMQEQIRQRSSFNSSNEVESRLQSLTQTLLTKQNTISSITTERNSLRFQLEKLQNEHGHVVSQLQRSQVKMVNMNDTDDVKAQVPKFLIMSPFDAGMTKRVKNAYSTLDAISIRTGVFLRRYPLARVFVFFYVVLLHLWVLLILFTYVPSSSK